MNKEQMRNGLVFLYADTLKQIAAKVGHPNPRPLNKLQTIAFIVDKAEHGEKRDYIVQCVNECIRRK